MIKKAELVAIYGRRRVEKTEKPKSWLDAFLLLEKHLQKIDDGSRQVVFKFYSGEFTVSKAYYNVLLQRQETLAKEVSRKMAIHNTLITTNGIKKNEYSGIFTNTITLKDLFRESR